MDMTYTSYLIPVVYAVYGFIFRFRTPEYLGRNGLPTKQSKRSEEIWNWFHRVAGIYCFAAAVLTAALAYWQTQVTDGTTLPAIFWIRMVIEIATIAAVIPVINALTLRKFPENAKETEKK